ncbi:uncharacterized protein LOC110723563 [Chenopodium quinoa]|uniref:uncharacterized protein LOC110723563 n=1 Tax=Chenopodium quinoa TaxID=63459 RepID=UPI000B77A3DC|nr:uncharacterized protein LOC110723563 [Chenopodium quinoa]
MAQLIAKRANEKIVEYGPYGSQSPTNYRIQLKEGERIKEVLVKHGWNVDAIGFLIERPDQSVVLEMTGEGGQTMSKIALKSGETVAGFSGTYGNKQDSGNMCVIATLKIHTNLCPEGYGPYGAQKGVSNVTFFTSTARADFLGVFGRAGQYLESLGAIYIQ